MIRDRTTVAAYLFGLDVRALAVLRIGCGLLLIYDAARRAFDHGWASPESVYDALVLYHWVLLVPCAIALTLGWKTRIATVLCWLIYLIPVRHDFFAARVDLGNYLHLLLLFWSMFLPLGAAWSIDRRSTARRVQDAPPPAAHLSVAGAALMIQIAIIYISAGVTKNFQEWVIDATAMETLMRGETFPTAIGRWTLNAPWLLKALSVATILLECFGPLLLFTPPLALNRRIRTVLVAVFILFHLGMFLMMKLNMFPFVCITMWLVFLPTETWDWLAAKRSPPLDSKRCAVDSSRVRNGLAGAALGYVLLSNLLHFAGPDAPIAREIQHAGKQVCLYQQWMMFNTPSKGRLQ